MWPIVQFLAENGMAVVAKKKWKNLPYTNPAEQKAYRRYRGKGEVVSPNPS